MKCPGCRQDVSLPHKCTAKDGKKFTLVSPEAAQAEDVFEDDGPQFSRGPENYALGDDEEHA